MMWNQTVELCFLLFFIPDNPLFPGYIAPFNNPASIGKRLDGVMSANLVYELTTLNILLL